MSWNSNPPTGMPMAKVKGFPGPLYPPDAAPGKKPSADSPFALACKRAAAHCGAWPWDPDGWDDSYSNRFAHGDQPATHAGIEGLQRWSGTLDATGWVGEKTFNFLRSVRIPQGRTHAGEQAYDSVCVQLTNQAYEAAHPPAPQTTVREAALRRAVGQIGYVEQPTNLTKFGDWYAENGVPWCAIFVTWCYEHGAVDVGREAPSFWAISQGAGSNDRYDYVPWVVSDARAGRFGLSTTNSPIPGDLVCYDWSRDGEHDHIGLVESWGGGAFETVEGNTSPSNNSNGGQVMRRSRNVANQGTVFVRVAEP